MEELLRLFGKPTRPRRRMSRELPPHLSDLMNKLLEHAAEFIRGFFNSEHRMREIVGEIQNIAAEVKKMQEEADAARQAGVDEMKSLNLLGAFAVFRANRQKTSSENQRAKEVEKLGKEFLWIVEPLKDELEDIKRTCERLEEESAKFQTENTLSDMEEFQRILSRVGELKRMSQGAGDIVILLFGKIGEMLVFIVNMFRVSPTPEEDKKLTDSIIQSADQSQKVVDKFQKMKDELLEFRKQ